MKFFRFFQSYGFTMVIIGVAIAVAVCISQSNGHLWNHASDQLQSINTTLDQK